MDTEDFHSYLGIIYEVSTADEVRLRWTVTKRVHQKRGLVHGGAHSSVVEAAASRGAALWWGDRGGVVGVSNHTDFLRPFGEGELTVSAAPIHRGQSQQLWEVRTTDGEQRLIARGQVRFQNLRA